MCVCVRVYMYVCVYHIFFIHSCVVGHLSCFHVLAIVNSAAMKIDVHVSLQIRIFIFSGYMLRSGIAGSYGNSLFLVFKSIYVILSTFCQNAYHLRGKICVYNSLQINAVIFLLLKAIFSHCPFLISVRGLNGSITWGVLLFVCTMVSCWLECTMTFLEHLVFL